MPDDFTHEGESDGRQWVKVDKLCVSVLPFLHSEILSSNAL
jgi:hypothetical protein